MKRASILLVLALALGSVACGSGTGRSRPRRTVSAALSRVGDGPYRFQYVEDVVSPRAHIEVRGQVLDDLRSRSTLNIDGKDVLEYIVSDDAMAVRVFDQGKAAPYIATVKREDKAGGDALAAGKWIVDHQGAPDLIAPRTGENLIIVGQNPILDASMYLFQYLTESMNASGGTDEFNPDSVDYNPLDDPWSEDADADLVEQGIRRYDVLQPALPRPTERGSGEALAGTPHFRKMAMYLDGRDVTVIKEQISIADRPEFRRAAAGRAAKYFTELLAKAQGGATRDPVRERSMQVTFQPADDVKIGLPAENFVSVPQIDLVTGIETLVPPRPQARVVAPTGGSGSPSPSSPGPTSSEAPTDAP